MRAPAPPGGQEGKGSSARVRRKESERASERRPSLPWPRPRRAFLLFLLFLFFFFCRSERERERERRRRGAASAAAKEEGDPEPPHVVLLHPSFLPSFFRRHERLELLHRQPDGRRHVPGRRHRRLQGRPRRLGRRPRKGLRQHHACGGEHLGGEGPQQPVCQRPDAGRAEVLRHPGQPPHGRGVHHGPPDEEYGRGPHLQHHSRHDQQDDSPGDGQGGRPRRLRQQEVLRDGQPLAAVTVLTSHHSPSPSFSFSLSALSRLRYY